MDQPYSKTHLSSSMEGLLFNGMIYRFISDPDDVRRTAGDMLAFADLANEKRLSEKIEKLDSADKIIERLHAKESVIKTFKNFLEASPYSLILVDREYGFIFNNERASKYLDALFDSQYDQKLKPELIRAILEKSQNSQSKLITLDNAVKENNVYVIANRQEENKKDNFNVLLIPTKSALDFELDRDLVVEFNLTKKEIELLSSLIQGFNLKEISGKSCTSINTVRSHLKSIFRKTDIHNQTDLKELFLNRESQLIETYFRSRTNSPNGALKESNSADLFVTLNTGNRLCYREYGPSDGRPLIIFHNTFGSRYHIPYNYREILEKNNRRIIIPERPGYGRSDLVKNHNSQLNGMLAEFANRLELNDFDILGNVLASALALRYAIDYPESLNKVILTSPVFINHSDHASFLGEFSLAASKLTKFSPKISSRTYQLWMKSMKFNTDRYVRNMVREYSGSAEQEAIKDENFVQRLTQNFIESQRNNSYASAKDSIFSLSPCKLNLSGIHIPIEIWIGDEDSLISIKGAKEICAPLPNKTFHIGKGHSEDIFYHRFEDIIA